ncbi:hypothetical protein M405DRAFT_934854, partial [Rhizopogon salebrosus TDB-379]
MSLVSMANCIAIAALPSSYTALLIGYYTPVMTDSIVIAESRKPTGSSAQRSRLTYPIQSTSNART